MNRNRKLVTFLLLLSFSVTLTGCSFRLGWVSSSKESSVSAKFLYFKGTRNKSIEMTQGDVLVVDYDISLDKGNLTLVITGPDGEIEREEATRGSNSRQFLIEAPSTGKYRLSLIGDWASGGYKLEWNIERQENS
jgi:hypothetical protein